MTSIAERVRAEADEAEAEFPDEPEDETAGEPEPEPEPEDEAEAEPEQPTGLAPIGPDEIRKAERAVDAQRRKLTSILGAEYVAHQCLLCSGLGFTPEPPPLGATFTVGTDADGLVLEVQPPPAEVPLEHAPDKTTCDECKGWGEVLTGSKAPHGMVAPCSKCAGNGWVMVARSEPVALDFGQVPQVPSPEAIAAASGGAPDAWGRPTGHAHWGVPPASVPG